MITLLVPIEWNIESNQCHQISICRATAMGSNLGVEKNWQPNNGCKLKKAPKLKGANETFSKIEGCNYSLQWPWFVSPIKTPLLRTVGQVSD